VVGNESRHFTNCGSCRICKNGFAADDVNLLNTSPRIHQSVQCDRPLDFLLFRRLGILRFYFVCDTHDRRSIRRIFNFGIAGALVAKALPPAPPEKTFPSWKITTLSEVTREFFSFRMSEGEALTLLSLFLSRSSKVCCGSAGIADVRGMGLWSNKTPTELTA
jgi:hypothetical protein